MEYGRVEYFFQRLNCSPPRRDPGCCWTVVVVVVVVVFVVVEAGVLGNLSS